MNRRPSPAAIRDNAEALWNRMTFEAVGAHAGATVLQLVAYVDARQGGALPGLTRPYLRRRIVQALSRLHDTGRVTQTSSSSRRRPAHQVWFIVADVPQDGPTPGAVRS